MGYYNIKQGILHPNLSKYYRFESVDTLCEQFNSLKNTLKKKGRNAKKNPWLDQNNERIHMSDRKILDKYVNLDKSCLTDVEKKQVMDMLYKYKDTFNMRDEIAMCPNIEVEIDVIDKSPFFIRPHHVKEEEKKDFR